MYTPKEFLDPHQDSLTTTHSSTNSNNKRHFWIDITVANSLPQVPLEHAIRVLNLEKFDVIRAHLDVVKDDDNNNGNVTMLRLCAAPREENQQHLINPDTLERTLTSKMKRTKWLDPSTMVKLTVLIVPTVYYSIARANITLF